MWWTQHPLNNPGQGTIKECAIFMSHIDWMNIIRKLSHALVDQVRLTTSDTWRLCISLGGQITSRHVWWCFSLEKVPECWNDIVLVEQNSWFLGLADDCNWPLSRRHDYWECSTSTIRKESWSKVLCTQFPSLSTVDDTGGPLHMRLRESPVFLSVWNLTFV